MSDFYNNLSTDKKVSNYLKYALHIVKCYNMNAYPTDTLNSVVKGECNCRIKTSYYTPKKDYSISYE